jgi:hypothetical protein
MADNICLTEKIGRIIATSVCAPESADLIDLVQDAVVIIFFFIYAALGAALAEIFASRKGPYSSVEFWKNFLPDRENTFYIRCDFVVKIFGGSLIALAAVMPTNERQAIAAGVGWAGALTAYLSKKAVDKHQKNSDGG